jgi:hypothetical protein
VVRGYAQERAGRDCCSARTAVRSLRLLGKFAFALDLLYTWRGQALARPAISKWPTCSPAHSGDSSQTRNCGGLGRREASSPAADLSAAASHAA